ncbi:hypothetical protein [Microterricola pindariensis]|uniref:DUF4190 domain-containing protein n=1 Tax=Microterricola pindariensis TaxID=478010 RepID=A0ABX5AY19_9MICO|nr:hypothetical protein [Microterricola pindariensis]PPL19785.1 hypothetical protein GY24_03980 [Microterricola pindariensis]
MDAQTDPVGVRPVLGTAVGALVAGLAALCFVALPLIGAPLGAVAVVSGLLARRELRRNDGVRGSRISLAGFLLGAAVLAFDALLLLLPFLLAALSALRA